MTTLDYREGAGESRSVWRCERCNAYHIGGLDLTSTDDDGGTWTAVCGATTTLGKPSDELWETWLIAEDPHPEMWGTKGEDHDGQAS